MSRPGPFEFSSQAAGTDLITKIRRLERELAIVKRDLNQAGAQQSLGWITAPAVPASTVPVTNETGRHVTIYWGGGSGVTIATIDGGSIAATIQPFRLKPGGTIALTYTTKPVWYWYAD